MTELDPDPLQVDEDALWDPVAAAWVPRPSALWALLVGLVIGAIAGALLTVSVVHATPRTSADSLPGVVPPTFEGSLPILGRVDSPLAGGASLSPTTPVRTASSAPLIDQMDPGTELVATGIASWYATSGPGLYAAAGPPLRTGNWRNRWVVVSANGRSVRVRLTDWCACRGRLIDLSADAFARLAPLSVGLVRVSVTWAGPGVTPPPTSTEGQP